MQTTQGQALQSLRAVDLFLGDHADRLPQVAGTGARRWLHELLQQLLTFETDQAAGTIQARGATQDIYRLRRVLVEDHMAPIVRLARLELANTPAVEPFRMPRGTPSVGRLGSDALGLARAAEPYAERFIAAGLPPDFVARLTRAADDLASAVTERARRRGDVHGATRGIRELLVTGRRLVYLLDAFVRSAARGDDALLTAWGSVSRVNRVGGRHSLEAAPPATLRASSMTV
jgi:hypothetical protein